MQIACLHTAHSNIDVFNAALKQLGWTDVVLRHSVRPDLLAAVEKAGGLTSMTATDTIAALHALSSQADAVLLSCSSLGPSVVEAQKRMSMPVVRADGALAEAALKGGRKAVVLYTVSATEAVTRAIFTEMARKHKAAFELRLVPGAWDLFKAGDLAGYLACIAEFADAAYAQGAAVVALGQASMAEAAKLCKRGVPVTSPIASLLAAAGR
ncbi:aspartate/glutamate racemase family protein [Lacibacterium aquatile]|uniref:Aspartate/glutamate racemase family protein n=1 Tax=Lacibacterium aquatile TaxID=1168082 RepID=A0ABW5DWT8_9PROT